MTYLIRFEGGPLDGETMENIDLPPIKYIQHVSNVVKYVPMGKNPGPDDIVEIETSPYYREGAAHYVGCVTYFWSEEDRDRAAYDDGFDPETREFIPYPEGLPTGMLPACQDSA